MEEEQEPEWHLHYRWFGIEAIELLHRLGMDEEASKFAKKEYAEEEENLLSKLCKSHSYFEYNLGELYRDLYDVMMALKWRGKKIPTQLLIDIGSRYNYVINELLNISKRREYAESGYIIGSIISKLQETIKVASVITNKIAEERRSELIGEVEWQVEWR